MRAARLALTAVVGTAAAVALAATDTVSGYVDTATTPVNAFAAAPDWTPPTASAAIVAKAAGGDPGWIRSSGSYYIYTNASDAGNPAAGIASIQAGVGNLSSSPTVAPETAGSYVIGGATYGWRSAALTAKSGLAAGSTSFGVTSTDAASPANAQTQSFAASVDNTPPTGVSIAAANGSGGIVGRPEFGDSVTYTFSEPPDANSVLAGWDGTTSPAEAAIYYDSNSGQDLLLVGAAGSTGATTPIGIVALGRSDYVPTSTVVYFGQSGTRSTLTRTGNAVTLVLGTPSSTATTAAGTGSMHWTPDAGATDRAGNPVTTTVVTESGTGKDF